MKKLRENLEHFIEYYLWQTIGIIVIVAVIASLIHAYVTQEEALLSFHIIKDQFTTDQVDEFEKRVASEFMEHEDDFFVVQSLNPSARFENPDVAILFQRFAAEVTAKEVDFVLLDEAAFRDFNKDGQLYDLNDLDSFKGWDGQTYNSIDNPEEITGIDVSEHPFFDSLVIDGEPLILSVIINTERQEKVNQFIDFIAHYPNDD